MGLLRSSRCHAMRWHARGLRLVIVLSRAFGERSAVVSVMCRFSRCKCLGECCTPCGHMCTHVAQYTSISHGVVAHAGACVQCRQVSCPPAGVAVLVYIYVCAW